jgi:integrase
LWLTKTQTAARVLNRVEVVLDFATTSGLRSGDNPARQTQTALPKAGKISAVNSFTALPYDEMGALMQKLAVRDESAAPALRFLILTAARSGEVRGACWPEIHFDKCLWIVPSSRMKAGREHRVPLSDAALDILRQIPRYDDGKIFPLGGHALLRAAKRLANVHAHGFRATFRTWATERTNFPDKIVEAALAHCIGDNKTQQTYERGDLLERRKKLMQAWADFCSKPVVVGDVAHANGRKFQQ